MSKKGRDSDEDEIKHIMITKKKSREWVLAKNPRLVSENPQKKDLRKREVLEQHRNQILGSQETVCGLCQSSVLRSSWEPNRRHKTRPYDLSISKIKD